MVRIFPSPPNSYVEMLAPKGDRLRHWGGEGEQMVRVEATWVGLVLLQETPQSSLALDTARSARSEPKSRFSWESTLLAPGPWTFSLQNREQQCLVLYWLPSLWCFVKAAQMD